MTSNKENTKNKSEERVTVPSTNVGSLLKSTRERHGLKLKKIAEELRIRFVYLEAIEEGDYEKMPGATYAVGFVRSYADYLGLNSKEIVKRFKEEDNLLSKKKEYLMPEPVSEAILPRGSVLVLSLIALVIVFAVWYNISSSGTKDISVTPDVPQEITESVGYKEAEAVVVKQEEAVDTENKNEEEKNEEAEVKKEQEQEIKTPEVKEVKTSQKEEVIKEEALTETETALDEKEKTEKEADVKAEENVVVEQVVKVTEKDVSLAKEEPKVYFEENINARVVIKAVARSWNEIKSPDGKVFFTGSFNEGDTLLVPDEEGLLLDSGNAGGIEIYVDGNKIKHLGVLGTVRRNVELDPEALLKRGFAE